MLASRVAARYRHVKAEILTKEWIMGVRRGWLKLMKPPIQDWGDVQQAFAKIRQFLNGLMDQVFFARRGPYTGTLTMSDGKKVLELLKRLSFYLNEAKDKAKHWQDVQEKRTLPGFKEEDAAHMLALYKSDFLEATSFSMEQRGSRWKHTTLTELMDAVLKLLREDAQRIKEHDEKNQEPYEDRSAFKEFDLYGMKIVIDDTSVEAGDIRQYLKLFDEAYQLLKQKGFAKTWYGTIFVRCESCGGENPHGNYGVGGNYHIFKDTVQVFSRPRSGIVHLIAHELGHRYWFKQMTQAQRGKFESLVKVYRTKKPDVKPELVPLTKLNEAHEAVDAAVSPLRATLKYFASAPVKWWRDTIKQNAKPLEDAAWEAGKNIQTAMSSTMVWNIAPDVKALQKDAFEATTGLQNFIANMDRDISAEVHKEPESTVPVPNVDKYWAEVFKRARPAWIEQAEHRLETAVAAAYIYLDASVQAWNEQEKARTDKLLTDWQQEFDQDERGVLPVSEYGRANIDEAWAEIFADYILGKDLTRDQIESFRSVLSTVVERYKQARIETLDIAWTEKLRKDFLVLMKNIPRVTDYETGAVLRQAFLRYRKNFDDFFFDKFLNPRKEEGNASFEGVRKAAWDFSIELKLPLGYPDEYSSEEKLFVRYEQTKRTWEQRLRAKAQKFWKALKDTLSYLQDQTVVVPDRDRLVLEGFQVEIVGHDPTSDWQQNSFAKFKEALRQYRRKAGATLPWLVQHQLPLVINFNSKLNEGGLYKTDHIIIAMSAMAGEAPEWGAHMLAHEMGHHLYRHLSGPAQAFWDAAIRQDYGPLDLRELLRKWPDSLRWASDFTDAMAMKDPVLALQIDVLSAGHGGRNPWEEREDFEKALAAGTETVAVPQTPITGYAGKNPEESFCEAIGRLVGYGPATVLPLVKHWLEVVIPGQTKLSSRVLARYRTNALLADP